MDKLSTFFIDANKRRVFRRYFAISLLFLLVISWGFDVNVRPKGEYSDKNHVALYVLKYGELPDNYVPKSESDTIEGPTLPLYDVFYNNEEFLPASTTYTEAYVGAKIGNIGPKRIVFSSDHVYYSPDHYVHFQEMTEWKILGAHRVFLIFFFLDLVGGIGITIWLIWIKKTLTIADVRTDIRNDLGDLKSGWIWIRGKIVRAWKKATHRN